MMDNFERMMALAEFGAKRNEEGRSLVFKMFVSYMTFLVVVAGLILRHWKDDALKYGSAGLVALLVSLMIVYWEWIVKLYTGLIYSVRRRDFFMKKAEVICYHSSKDLADADSEKVSINLGSGNRYQRPEKYLFGKRAPDIKNCLGKIPKGKNKPPSEKPVIWNDRYFLFNLLFPLFLTLSNIVALIYLNIHNKFVIMAIVCGGAIVAVVIFWALLRGRSLNAKIADMCKKRRKKKRRERKTQS